jgi:ribosomal peptide maturation radical SAM protein 1
MPYGAIERPSLALGLLQASLRRRGIACETRYLAFTFADFVGLDDYMFVYSSLPYTAFAGDWTFTGALYGDLDDTGSLDTGYVDQVLRGTWYLDDEAIGRVERVRAHAAPFIEHCLATIDWSTVDVVGFTSTFEQNVASLALARRVKAAHPGIVTAFGGANWEGEMGAELVRQFPFVDLACCGEADDSFPAVLAALARDSSPGALDQVPGVVHRLSDRDSDSVTVTGSAAMVTALDDLAIPDFDDFFAAVEASRVCRDVTPRLMVETSRGCWWGARSHCTFCGLNGGTMAFRSKGPDRVLEELAHLVGRHGVRQVNVVDNILDMRYFRTVLPRVAAELPGLDLFYEVKANLSHRQVAQLARAGVREVQPGIESLSDHVLELMRKGTTALRNVQLLKWCRELGVKVAWNLIYGFPGETPEDYAEMVPLLEAIRFLDAPTGCGPIRLDRFSPFHEHPDEFGMRGIRPLPPYAHLYPGVPEDALLRIAYYFDIDYDDGRVPETYAAPVIELCRAWQAQPPGGGLWLLGESATDDHVTVLDHRKATPSRIDFDGWQAALYQACDRTLPLAEALRLPALRGVPVREVAAVVNRWVDQQLMLVRSRICLSLAVHTPARTDPGRPPGPGLDEARRVDLPVLAVSS